MTRTCLALAVLAGLFAAAPAARAQTIGPPPIDSETDTIERHGRFRTPQRFAFELRFGAYRPHVDDQFPQDKPFERAFGPDRSPFYLGLEFDWQFFRIPKVGTLGAGFGWGYSTTTGNAADSATGEPSPEDTTLSVMPMYGVGVFRLDYLARETVIPVVGYVKAGLGYGLWWASNDISTQGKGHTWGTHFALGGMLLLDALDEHAAGELDNEWGVNNTYFFAEWMVSNLDGLNRAGDRSVMNIGANTYVLGLAIEM